MLFLKGGDVKSPSQTQAKDDKTEENAEGQAGMRKLEMSMDKLTEMKY